MKVASLSFSILSLFVGTSVFAAQTEILSCSTKIEFPGVPALETLMQIIDKDGQLVSLVTQAGITREDKADFSEHKIRAALTGEADLSNSTLNQGEKLIAHALTLQSDPVLAGLGKLSFDLTAIRSAKVYVVGDSDNMGLSAIVVASDASGKKLGTFLGGFLVSECK